MKPELIALKRATGETIKGVGGLEAAAGFCRVGKSALGEAQNINCEDRWISVDVVADLEPLAQAREGWPHVTQWLCQQMGGTFVPLPIGTATRTDLLRSMGRVAKEAADVTQAICAAIGDGVVQPEERAAIRKQIREAQAELATLDAQLAAEDGDS